MALRDISAFGSQRQLRLLTVRTSANKFTAAGTAVAVFFGNRLGKIDAGDVGDRGEPGQHVGKFAESLFVRAAAKGRRELADFFDEPQECSFDPAGLILFKIHFANQRLQVGQ